MAAVNVEDDVMKSQGAYAVPVFATQNLVSVPFFWNIRVSSSFLMSLNDDCLRSIFGHLAFVSKWTLATCAVASKRFHWLATPELYRQVCLDTRVPGGKLESRCSIAKNFVQDAHRHHLDLFRTVIPTERLRHIRHLILRLQFHTQVWITPNAAEAPPRDPIYLDEDEIAATSAHVLKDAWKEFMQRCGLITNILARLRDDEIGSSLQSLEYIVDADCAGTRILKAREFYFCVKQIAARFQPSHPSSNWPRLTNVSLRVTRDARMGHPLLLSPLLTAHAPGLITCIEIDDAEGWLDAQIAQLLAGAGPLRELSLRGAAGAGGEVMAQLAGGRHTASLRGLVLTGARRVEDIALFRDVLQVVRGLERLDLSGSVRVWVRRMEEYGGFDGTAWVQLRDLNVEQCTGLPMRDLCEIVGREAVLLERLCVGETGFDDADLQAILHSGNRLTVLDVHDCSKLTESAWKVLQSGGFLRTVNVKGCHGMMEPCESPALSSQLMVHNLRLETVHLGPITRAKLSFRGWCLLVHAQRIGRERDIKLQIRGERFMFCERYLTLKVREQRASILSIQSYLLE